MTGANMLIMYKGMKMRDCLIKSLMLFLFVNLPTLHAEFNPGDVFLIKKNGYYSCPDFGTGELRCFDIVVDIASIKDSDKVGILWTSDNWATQNEALANKLSVSFNSQFDSWQVRLTFNEPYYEIINNFQFAIYTDIGDRRVWDRFNNYRLEGNLAPGNPVKLVNSDVKFHTNEIEFIGFVETFNFRNASNKPTVAIRYTIDDWNTFKEEKAEFISDSLFRFKLYIKEEIKKISVIRYAIKYTYQGKDFWDNNNNKNYLKVIMPFVNIRLDSLSHRTSMLLDSIDKLNKPIYIDKPIDGGLTLSIFPRFEDASSISSNSDFVEYYYPYYRLNDNSFIMMKHPHRLNIDSNSLKVGKNKLDIKFISYGREYMVTIFFTSPG